MKGKQIFYWLSLLLCLAVAGCSSDGEDEVTPKDEPGEEGGGGTDRPGSMEFRCKSNARPGDF